MKEFASNILLNSFLPVMSQHAELVTDLIAACLEGLEKRPAVVRRHYACATMPASWSDVQLTTT